MDLRLKKQSDFNEVFRKGKRSYAKNLALIYIKKSELKVGISVSKKHGNAVKRNRIKRLIRAVYYPLLDKLPSYHIVFLPKTGIDFSYNDLLDDIKYLLRKEKLLNENDFN